MSASALIENQPRERSGSVALRAFDFQMHASMARILDAHARGERFFAYFDYFDDLVMVEEGDGGTAMSFYQVKAAGNTDWTPSRLASRQKKGDLPRSIIGKAYQNLHQFGTLVHKASIISNRHLNARYATGAKTSIEDGEILLSELCAKDHGNLIEALELDFPAGVDPRHEHVLKFERIPLDIQSFQATLLGLVNEMLAKLDPTYELAARPFYLALLNEILRCTGHATKPKTLDELSRNKGLGNDAIEALIQSVESRSRTPIEWWSTVEADLRGTGWSALRLLKLRQRCLEYWRARQRGNPEALALSDAIRTFLVDQPSVGSASLDTDLSYCIVGCDFEEILGRPYDRISAFVVEIVESLA